VQAGTLYQVFQASSPATWVDSSRQGRPVGADKNGSVRQTLGVKWEAARILGPPAMRANIQRGTPAADPVWTAGSGFAKMRCSLSASASTEPLSSSPPEVKGRG
jgi:hypothetical protein